ncbi:MAG: Clp protease N-terminal domain-containing protein [Candidatus Melainabacteria bacterium]|nr:Clp protease N-terminal domain-containing protein [Candidatus Melainabacteria bacterium]
MLENFSKTALSVIIMARLEAIQSRHNIIGTEMILLGLITENKNTAAQVLKTFGLDREILRVEVRNIKGIGDKVSEFAVPIIPYTDTAKKVIKNAQKQSLYFGKDYVMAEHLLLGIVDEGLEQIHSGAALSGAVAVLDSLEIDLVTLKTKILDLVSVGPVGNYENPYDDPERRPSKDLLNREDRELIVEICRKLTSERV